MKASLPYIRNKSKSTAGGRIGTFFPSFVGLALRGDDLLFCEAAKRFSTGLNLITIKDFLSREPSTLKTEPLIAKARWKPVILSWPRERTMVRELYVSDTNLRELRETLALQLDSLFPLGPGEAYFDLYPCAEGSASGRKVYLFAVNKRELDDVVSRLEVIGLVPSRIVPSPIALLSVLEKKVESVVFLCREEGGKYIYNLYRAGGLAETHVCDTEEGLIQDLGQDSPEAILALGFGETRLSQIILDALPEETLVTYLDPSWEAKGAALYETYGNTYDFNLRRPTKRSTNYQNLYLVSLIALILSLLYAIPQIVQIKDKERLSLVEAEIEGIKSQAFELKKMEGVARAQKALDTVLESQKGYVPKADVLLELTKLLPEDVWIKELSVKDGTFEVEGVATFLAETMFLLEDSPIFSNVELIPPLVKDKDGKEHFRLKGNILQEETREKS